MSKNTTDSLILSRKEGQIAYVRSGCPPPPFQTGTFRHVVRILGEISAPDALSGERSAPLSSPLKMFLHLCDQLVEKEAAMLKSPT